MSNVIKFPGHKLFRCKQGCEGCFACRGGLALCVTCGGAEASLPTHCPGEHMDSIMATSVQEGLMDYHDGAWRYYDKGEWRAVFDG